MNKISFILTFFVFLLFQFALMGLLASDELFSFFQSFLTHPVGLLSGAYYLLFPSFFASAIFARSMKAFVVGVFLIIINILVLFLSSNSEGKGYIILGVFYVFVYNGIGVLAGAISRVVYDRFHKRDLLSSTSR